MERIGGLKASTGGRGGGRDSCGGGLSKMESSGGLGGF